MIKLNNQRFENKWFYILGISLVIGIIIWGCHSPIITSSTDKPEYNCFEGSWSQIIDDEAIRLNNIHNFIPVEQGERLTFTCTLTDIEDEKALLFYTDNQEVICTIDGKVVHEFVMQKKYKMLKTPGSVWNQIDLDSSMSGKKMVISFYSPISSYNNNFNHIYYADATDVDSIRLKYLMFRSVVSCVMFVLVIIFFSSSKMWKNIKRKQYFFAIGQYYLFMLVVLLSGIGFFDLLLGRPIVSYLLNQLFMRLIPISLWRLAVNSVPNFKYPNFMRGLRFSVAFNLFVSIILQFVFGVSFLETIWMHNIILLVMIASMSVMGLKKLLKFKKLSSEEYPCFPLGFIFIGGFLDMVFANVFTEMRVFGGMSSVVFNILFLIFVYVMIVKEDAKLGIEKLELEKSYKKLKNSELSKQINAHFIFNTLNTISAYCKEDPQEADRAIVVFSDYLRAYMGVITEERVHILEEMDLIENLLEIEKMRFEDFVSFELDIKYDNFYIPPFTLQPLVENSINHGFRKTKRKGEIKITTMRDGDYAKIIVEDTGVGFDTNMPFEETSLGIKNTQKRIRMLTGGTLEITSKIDVGTKAVITLPRNGDEENIDDL